MPRYITDDAESPASRGRGLKQYALHGPQWDERKSPASRGRGLKREPPHLLVDLPEVARITRAWIETISRRVIAWPFVVARITRAWIETETR